VLRHIAERDANKPSTKKPKRKSAKNPPPKKIQKTEETLKIQKTVPTKCMKYRIFPNTNQKETLKLWTDATRWIYNKTVEQLNSRKPGTRESLSLLREWAGIEDETWTIPLVDGGETAPARFKTVPYEIRDSPIRDIAGACTSLRSKEKVLKRKLKFRGRKDDVASITLRARQLNCKTERGGVWPSLFGTVHSRSAMKTECGKTLPLVFSHDCRLVYERRTRFFYLCVPISTVPITARSPETQGVTKNDKDTVDIMHMLEEKRGKLASIDPGLRTFGTCYDPDGIITEWAEGSAHLVVLFRLSRKAGRIESRASRVGGRKKRRLAATAARIRKRSIDLVNELHRKFARWLCSTHEVVLLPKFSTRSIVRKRSDATGAWTRKIGRKTAGSAMRLAHYKFRNFLLHKASEIGTKVELCDEQYTSKTCGICGVLNETLGASKTFTCAACGFTADRDHNAARNILLRYLTINEITFG
jgi:putative transposase